MEDASDGVVEVPAVPPVRYTFAVAASAGPSATTYPPPTVTGTVEAYRSAPGWSNYILFLVAIVLWPFIAWRQARAFESRRWSESDYGDEYSSGGGDDDGDE